jgi:F0F1-type ATP synthase membrane subunit b/b'
VEHGADHLSLGELIASLKFFIINFALYLGVMVWLYRKLGKNLVRARSVQIRQDLEHAHGAISSARNELEKAALRLKGVSVEQDALIARLEQDGRDVAETVRNNTAKGVRRILEDSELQAEREAESARALVRRDVVERATKLARQKLQAGLPAAEEEKLRRQALRSLFE